MVLRYVFRHIPRALAKSLLSLLLAAALIAALGQFTLVVRSNRALVEEMYDTVEVLANVVNRSGVTGTGVPYDAIDLLLDVKFSSEYYAEAAGACYWVPPTADDTDETSEPAEPVFYDTGEHTLYNVTDPVRFGKVGEITYAEGYDASVFLTERKNLCFVSAAALEQYNLEYGDRIRLSGVDAEVRMRAHESTWDGIAFTIIGSFDGGLGDYDILTPFWTMANIHSAYYLESHILNPDGDKAQFVEFRIDNGLLRDEAAYKDAPNDALAASIHRDISSLTLRVRDDEVQNVIKPLDENTDLLELLLPVICGVVLIIGAAIPGLVIIQSSREASIMRVLGTPKSKVRTILLIEQMLLSLIGLATGLMALAAAHGFGDAVTRNAAEILGYAAGYAALTTAVCLACSISVSAGKPLELLQTKE